MTVAVAWRTTSRQKRGGGDMAYLQPSHLSLLWRSHFLFCVWAFVSKWLCDVLLTCFVTEADARIALCSPDAHLLTSRLSKWIYSICWLAVRAWAEAALRMSVVCLRRRLQGNPSSVPGTPLVNIGTMVCFYVRYHFGLLLRRVYWYILSAAFQFIEHTVARAGSILLFRIEYQLMLTPEY